MFFRRLIEMVTSCDSIPSKRAAASASSTSLQWDTEHSIQLIVVAHLLSGMIQITTGAPVCSI